MLLFGRAQAVLSVIDDDDVRYLLGELKSVPELDGHWIEMLLSELSLRFPELTTEFFLTRVDRATGSDEAFSQTRPINYGPWVHVRLRFKESPRYGAVLEGVWQWIAAHDPSDWRFEHHASALFEGMFLPIDEAVLGFLADKIATADTRHLRWIASILSHAEADFIFVHHKLVVMFLDACDRAGGSVRRKAILSLVRSATSGVRSGRPGEPFPRDVECLEASLALLPRLPRLSSAYELYDTVRAHSESGITLARQDAEFSDDA